MKNTDQLSRDSIEYYKERTEKLEMEKEALEAKLKWYEEQFRLSQQRRFGSSSEKTNLLQRSHSNEAEHTAAPALDELTVQQTTHQRTKQRAQRAQKLETMPTETIEYPLPTEEQDWSCCGGELHEISTEARIEIEAI